MGEFITLTTADRARINAWRARPSGTPRGGLVVVQEIFGVTAHIRAVADRFAKAGYLVVAPALFDRVEVGVELPYGPASIPRARELRAGITLDQSIADIAAAADAAGEGGKVGVVGYCWGGTLAYTAAARLPQVAAAIGYYPGDIGANVDAGLRKPVMLHFGEQDHLIAQDEIAAVRATNPDVTVHLYPAGHGFNCDERPSYDQASATLAMERTLVFLDENLAS